MTVHAAILCRVSTGGQGDNTSIPDQRRMLTELCDARGWTYEVFEEVQSGGDLLQDRPVFSDIMARIKAGEFSRLVLLVVDRGTRAGAGEMERIGELLAKAGAKLVTRRAEYDPRETEDQIDLERQALDARAEKMRIRDRTIRGREARIREGGFAGHPTPFGWRRVWAPDGSYRFDIEPAEAAVVREVVALYLTGLHGIKVLAARFGLSYALVSSILSSPRYAGIEHFRGAKGARNTSGRDAIKVPSKVWTAIISAEDWEACAAMRARKLTPGVRAGGPAKHPLSGILRCDGCAGPMYYVIDHGTVPTYMCRGRDCPERGYLHADDAHQAVMARLPDLVAHWQAYQSAPADDPHADARRELTARLTRMGEEEVTLLRQVSRGAINDDQFARMNQTMMNERAAVVSALAAIETHRPAAVSGVNLGDAAAVVAGDADALADPSFLRMVFGGLLETVSIGKTGERVSHWYKSGTRTRPVLALTAATLVGGVVWTRTVGG